MIVIVSIRERVIATVRVRVRVPIIVIVIVSIRERVIATVRVRVTIRAI